MEKIPAEKMDAVDQQQQREIDNARSLAIGALVACVTISIVQLGAFVFALYEMGRVVDVLRAALR